MLGLAKTKAFMAPQKVEWWGLLGPFVVILSLLISLLKAESSSLYLPSVLVGIPLCVLYREKGVFLSCAILTTLLAIFWNVIPQDDRFWQLGLAFTIGLGFVVTSLSAEEVKGVLATKDQKVEEGTRQVEEISLVAKTLETRVDELEKRAADLLYQCEEAMKVKDKQSFYIHELEESLTSQKKMFSVFKEDIDALSEQKKQLLSKIMEKTEAAARLQAALDEAFGKSAALDEKVKRLEIANSQLMEQATAKAENVPQLTVDKDLKETYDLYKQLKVQFEEKTLVLHQARSELFTLEGKVHALQKELEEAYLKPRKEEIALQKELSGLLEQNRLMDEELSEAKEIISSFFSK